jgi:HEAT repeat protein
LASWLKDDNDPFVIYVALKACLELKSVYEIDGVAPETDFLDLSLGAFEKADGAGKYCVAQLLGFYRDQRARDILVKMLEADDSTLVYYALLSLGRIGAPAEVPKLVLFLNSPDKALVAAACRALDSLLNYDAGQDVTFLPDYRQALDEKARQWLAWWREHSREFPEGN